MDLKVCFMLHVLKDPLYALFEMELW